MAKTVTGPVQALVIGFDKPDLNGRILGELRKVRKRGVIRVVDVLFVKKGTDGTIASSMHQTALTEAERIRLGGLIGGLVGLETGGIRGAGVSTDVEEPRMGEREYGMSADQLADLGHGIPNDSSGVILVIEHHWAAHLRDAIVDAGGRLLVQAMLGADVVASIERELDLRLEAETAIEEAETARLAVAMEVARGLTETELVDEAALAEAVDVVAGALAVEGATEAGAVDALVEAQLVEPAAAEGAAEMVAEALASEDAAASDAAAAVEAAQDIKAAAVIEALRAIYSAKVIGDEAAQAAVDTLVVSDIIEAEAAAESVDAVRGIPIQQHLSSR